MSNKLLGIAGGMLVVAGSLAGGYYVIGTRSEARAATVTDTKQPDAPKVASQTSLPQQPVEIKFAGRSVKMTWAELGIETDQDEVGKTSIPVKLDRDKAIKALFGLKAKFDK